MLPKDKAKEIYWKCHNETFAHWEWEECVHVAKQCALICVNELIQEFNFNAANEEAKKYWIEVKNEINKL